MYRKHLDPALNVPIPSLNWCGIQYTKFPKSSLLFSFSKDLSLVRVVGVVRLCYYKPSHTKKNYSYMEGDPHLRRFHRTDFTRLLLLERRSIIS